MASRTQAKQRARAERLRQEQEQAARDRRRRILYGWGVGGLLVAGVIAAVVLLAVVAGGGDAGGGQAVAGENVAGTGEAGHIHGLGIDPADGALFIATHSGLFRSGQGEQAVRRVGGSDRDVMGFSVVGPGHFVASGHPGSETDLPANLGLIESRDGGRTFTPVALLGEADFHVLRAAGRFVYGFDGANGRFMASADGGRTFEERDVPTALFDLAIDPQDPQHLVAAGENGLLESRDGGRAWTRTSDAIALLAWGEPGELLMLTQEGRIEASTDAGRTSRPRGEIPGPPVAFSAQRGKVLVGLADGTVLESSDGGASMAVRARL